jgi:hypothetical protein
VISPKLSQPYNPRSNCTSALCRAMSTPGWRSGCSRPRGTGSGFRIRPPTPLTRSATMPPGECCGIRSRRSHVPGNGLRVRAAFGTLDIVKLIEATGLSAAGPLLIARSGSVKRPCLWSGWLRRRRYCWQRRPRRLPR